MTEQMHVEEAVAGYRDWLVTKALPLWATIGFDAADGSFVERLSLDGRALGDLPRRAMVQARQIYVYAHAASLGWFPAGRDLALTAARRLVAGWWAADGAPGWVHARTTDGTIPDPTRDFYAHSFALYGLAWAYRLSPEPAFLEAADATLGFLDRHFASPSGGCFSTLPADLDRREQNPHMHLFEAMLAWHAATGEARFLARAGELRTMMAARFFRADPGVLPEYFDGRWERRAGPEGEICEPGHHYEWSWLLRGYARLVGRGDDPIAVALKAFADHHGFDGEGLIVDELRHDGSVHRASRRSWPHTEAIKAEVAAFEQGDTAAAGRAARVIGRLRSAFLDRTVEGGWIDRLDAAGAPMVDHMPASTLYHLFLAAAEADRVWGRDRG